MGGTMSREAYLDIGLDVLSDLGYGGLKLAEVCRRLGVTTGSFYHYFNSWSAYREELLAHWEQTRTASVAAKVADEADPRRRIDILFREALALPYRAEAGIRVWSAVDPAVSTVQTRVDLQRYDMLFAAAYELHDDEVTASRFATAVMYMMIGCEQATLPRVPGNLRWISAGLLGALDLGIFGSGSDAD